VTHRTGRCLCGAVTYRLAADPLVARLCWCHDCQHLSGNGTVNMIVPSEALTVSGTTNEFASAADSGNMIRRRFCPGCGAHLFANADARPQFTVVRVGTLDEPSSVKPSINMWAGSAPSWACLDPQLQRVEGQPPPPGSQPVR
jgi:hypothetical protein